MHCKNCLAPLSTEDTYCKVCGTPVAKSGQYPSNEEIIKAYNTEMGLPPIEQEMEEKQDSFQTQVSKSLHLEERGENAYSQIPKREEQNTVASSMPQHEPILTAPTPNRSVPKLEVTKEEVRPLEEENILSYPLGLSKKTFVLGIVIAIVITACITTLICIPVLSKTRANNELSVGTNQETKTVTENRILFSGYSFIIPEGYSYKLSGTQLVVEKTDTKEAMSLQVGAGTYDNMKASLNPLKTNLTNAKWTVGKLYVDQTIKGRNYLTVEATVSNQKIMLAYTTADETQIFGIVYLKPNATDYPSNTIEVFTDIIDSALKVENTVTTNILDFTKNKLLFTVAELTKTDATKTDNQTTANGQATTTNNQNTTNTQSATTTKNP